MRKPTLTIKLMAASGCGLLLLQTASLRAQDPTPAASPATTPTCPACSKDSQKCEWHGHGGMHHGPGKMDPVEMLGHVLELTDAQKQQVAAAAAPSIQQLKQIHEEEMAKMKPIIQTMNAQIRPLLTPDQQAKLDKIEAHFNGSAPAAGGQ